MPLTAALQAAAEQSPRLKGARYHMEARHQEVRVQKGGYWPELSAAAVAQTGAPGSFAFMGVDNNISSAQRIGAGGALVVKQNLWDFGRTESNVEASEAQERLEGDTLHVIEDEVAAQVLRTYVSCAFLKTQRDDSRFMAEQARMIARETGGFVRSGQRSVVERDLVDAQAREAETLTAELNERVRVVEQRLAIELNRPASEPVHCTNLDGLQGMPNAFAPPSGPQPLLAAEARRVDVARAQLRRAKAGARPSIIGLATGGYFDNDNLHDKWNYSAGVGVSLPLFAGFAIDSNIDREAAELAAAEAGRASSQQAVDRANSNYDERIDSLRVRLDFLEKENKLARRVFDLARKRYSGFQGTMVDLREAIKNLSRVLMTTDEAYRDLYIAVGERALFNGAPLPR